MAARSSLRVAKTYAPDQDGAKRFARRFGDQLVCVRQRLNDTGTVRHTTVELLVETTPVVPRGSALVALRISPNDKALRTLLMARGARWQPKQRYWLVSRAVAKELKLLGNLVPIQG